MIGVTATNQPQRVIVVEFLLNASEAVCRKHGEELTCSPHERLLLLASMLLDGMRQQNLSKAFDRPCARILRQLRLCILPHLQSYLGADAALERREFSFLIGEFRIGLV